MKRYFFRTIIFSSTFLFFILPVFGKTHEVKSGDTFYSISRAYGISVDQLCAVNSISKDSVLKLGQKLIIPEISDVKKTGTQDYIVSKDDTFYSISKKYNITVDQLCELNSISKNSVLKLGQKLKVPSISNSSVVISSGSSSPVSSGRSFDSYTVQKGDTFYRIAKINGISVDELKNLNNLSGDSNELKIGQQLKIPKSVVDSNKSLPDLPSNDPRNYSTKKGDSSLTWPVKNPSVTYTKGKVSGVQLTAAKNESVTAIRAGTVMYVGNYRGYGQVIFIQSKTDYIYAYSGLGSIKVKKGDYVVFGDVLGTAGTDSIKGTPQITLMVFQKSAPIDPAKAPRG